MAKNKIVNDVNWWLPTYCWEFLISRGTRKHTHWKRHHNFLAKVGLKTAAHHKHHTSLCPPRKEALHQSTSQTNLGGLFSPSGTTPFLLTMLTRNSVYKLSTFFYDWLFVCICLQWWVRQRGATVMPLAIRGWTASIHVQGRAAAVSMAASIWTATSPARGHWCVDTCAYPVLPCILVCSWFLLVKNVLINFLSRGFRVICVVPAAVSIHAVPPVHHAWRSVSGSANTASAARGVEYPVSPARWGQGLLEVTYNKND